MSSIQTAIESWLEFANKQVQPYVVGKSQNDLQIVNSATFVRVTLWLESLRELPESRHYQAHATAARALFEMLVDLLQLQRDPTSAAACLDFTFVKRFRMARQAVAFCTTSGGDLSRYAQQSSFCSPSNELKHNALVAKHGWTRFDHWWGANGRERAKAVDKEETYVRLSALLSLHVHAGVAGIDGIPRETLDRASRKWRQIALSFANEAVQIVADSFAVESQNPAYMSELADVLATTVIAQSQWSGEE